MSFFRMRLDDRELGVGQLAGLVEHFDRHGCLAEVVQQAGNSGGTCLSFVEAKLPGKRDHQRAYGDRMHVGVVVGSLQAGEADQGAGVAADRVGDLFHQALRPGSIDRVAHARFLEHRGDRLPGFGDDLCCTGEFD